MINISTILILVCIVFILGLLIYIALKSNKEVRAIDKAYKEAEKKEKKANEARVKINEEYNKKKENIDNNDSVFTDDVVSVKPKCSHNHSFLEPCSENCPAYIGDK